MASRTQAELEDWTQAARDLLEGELRLLPMPMTPQSEQERAPRSLRVPRAPAPPPWPRALSPLVMRLLDAGVVGSLVPQLAQDASDDQIAMVPEPV